jgi:predicted SnoaL-like aldol condensation-catalyzing enzyme
MRTFPRLLRTSIPLSVVASALLISGCSSQPGSARMEETHSSPTPANRGAAEPPAPSPSSSAQEEANKKTVIAFYEAGLNRKDFDAASLYFGPYYKQHDPISADGVEGFRAFVDYLKKNAPDFHSEIKRVFADGDYVILHIHNVIKPGDRGRAIVAIFRLENGKIVEHWDVVQELPKRTASENPMF